MLLKKFFFVNSDNLCSLGNRVCLCARYDRKHIEYMNEEAEERLRSKKNLETLLNIQEILLSEKDDYWYPGRQYDGQGGFVGGVMFFRNVTLCYAENAVPREVIFVP